jgi:Zn-dependent peptidase ImmA (M78 family)
MIHLLTKMKKVFPNLNRVSVTEDDFWRVVNNENIFVHFWQLAEGVKGFYGANKKYKIPRHYIVINSKLLPNDWLPTALHELVHHFLHAPQSNLKVYFSSHHATNHHDLQADAMMLIMLIPLPLFVELSKTPFEELGCFSLEMLLQRKEIFERYGI